MLKDCNDQQLVDDKKLNHDLVSFYQHWKELTESRTVDTYQYKSMNTLNGILELIHNINAYLSGLSPTSHYVLSSANELLSIVGKDPVMRKSFPSIKNRILQCLSKKAETAPSLNSLKHQLSAYLSEIERTYNTALVENLSSAINEKSADQYSLTSLFISRCVDLGWSVTALFFRIDKLRDSAYEASNISAFLNKIINAQAQEYAVLFPFRFKIVLKDGKAKAEQRNTIFEELGNLGTPVFNCERVLQELPLIEKDKLSSSLNYMEVTTKASDIFSASHLAVCELSKVLNILSFFSTIESWSISSSNWVVFNKETPYTKTLNANDIYRTYEYLDSSSRVYYRTAHILTASSPTNLLSQKLLSSFSYANLSRSSMALEEKYINMWIALESLCRTDSYENIISSVITAVSNASCLRYIYRDIRNFVEDCFRCGVSLKFSSFSICPTETKKEIMVEKAIVLFHDPTLLSDLQARCEVNTLLHKRCLDISAIMNDSHEFASRIITHHTTIEWHLNRLYRIRNEIAHSGSMQQMYTIRYTEHLYDYLATLVSEIVRFSTEKSTQNIDEIFALINGNYAEFHDIAMAKKACDKATAFGSLWNTGIINYI